MGAEFSPHRSTRDRLLDTLRQATGRPDLEFVEDPVELTGGFSAELLRFRLVDPPPHLDHDLVARIVPVPSIGVWEAAIQGTVADQGFRTPAVRLTVDETSALGRYLIVMDEVDGAPPLDGLGAGAVLMRLPRLLHDLPRQLALVAFELHQLDPDPLAERLDRIASDVPTTTAGFVRHLVGQAEAVGAVDLGAAGRRLMASEPDAPSLVIAHGDLHPFNLLETADGPVLIDWTLARVADPAFTVAFTHLILGSPPVPSPRAAAPLLHLLGRSMARRFLATYRSSAAGTPAAVDDRRLEWHRRVHALRILTELAAWSDGRPSAGHPWLLLEPAARRVLGLPRSDRPSR